MNSYYVEIPGTANMIERIDITWLGIAVPALILILSILVVWGIYNFYSKKQ
ncbi:MAG: hypothetical protein SVN78_01755 [Deferribacterota bacterium]|nr:hypothetical protein [Deferribacterota bacterium]